MKPLFVIAALFFSLHANSQETGSSNYLSFDDVSNFWRAYDKVMETTDSSEQIKIIQSQYLNKVSPELRLMLMLEHFGAADYMAYIRAYPKFWRGLRERTRYLMTNFKSIEIALRKLKSLYKRIEIPSINFTVGCFDFGGRAFADKVMIGTEVVLADGNFDASTFSYSPEAYQDYIVSAVIYFALHETVHTVQPGVEVQDLLTECIKEGSCDFIAELAMARPLQRPYLVLGNEYEKKLWESFKKEMNGFVYDKWLYNKGLVAKGEEDLGYFIGYAICKYYYYNTADKKKAIRRIMNLNYANSVDIYKFFLESGYEKKSMVADR